VSEDPNAIFQFDDQHPELSEVFQQAKTMFGAFAAKVGGASSSSCSSLVAAGALAGAFIAIKTPSTLSAKPLAQHVQQSSSQKPPPSDLHSSLPQVEASRSRSNSSSSNAEVQPPVAVSASPAFPQDADSAKIALIQKMMATLPRSARVDMRKTLSDICTEELSLLTPELETDVKGCDEVLDYWTNIYDAFDSPVFTSTGMSLHREHEGSREAQIKIRWKFEGKHTKVVFGIPPSQRMIELSGMTMISFGTDNKISHQDWRWNHTKALLSLLPVSPVVGKT